MFLLILNNRDKTISINLDQAKAIYKSNSKGLKNKYLNSQTCQIKYLDI